MTKYINGYDEFINKIDFEDILNCVINNEDYESIYDKTGIKRENLLKYEKYKKYDEHIKKQLALINNTNIVVTSEQCKTNDNFFHVAINRRFSDPHNKFRIYMSPTDENLYLLVNELLKRSYRENKKIYLKYGRQNRLDKIVMYLQSKDDLLDKLDLIEKIKKEHPNYFVNMGKSSFWISPSKIDGVYISPEAHIKKIIDGNFPSFGILMNSVIGQIKEYLYFALGELGEEKDMPLKKYNKDYLMSLFKPICQRMLAMYGAFIYLDKNELKMFYSDEFPGIYMPINEYVKFNRDTKKLEVLKRYDNEFVLYEVPLGSPIYNNYEDSDYVFYDIKNAYEYMSYGLNFALNNNVAVKRNINKKTGGYK